MSKKEEKPEVVAKPEEKPKAELPKPEPKVAPSQAPSLGRIVHYALTEEQAAQVSASRKLRPRRGNEVLPGQVYPMIITQVWPDSINGQVFLDGSDSLWVTSAHEGKTPGTWCWPPKV